ncbi:LysR family transcriptional regulator [Novilysobacter antarcticus]|uniref:LysR family transcriptional regulator n=1 Tax=Novilysobacter antarcticus TaxID=2862543 RepID=UPI001C999F32
MIAYPAAMDIRQLRYFLAVVEHGSFTRAAAMTGRTQQALSKGIAALEQQLGARLFERGSRGARPTAVGRLLLDHARTADATLRTFEQRLHELQTGTEGEIRIGTGPTAAGSVVAPAVLALRAAWPRLGVRVTGGVLPELLPALLARELDVVVALDTMLETDPRLHRDLLVNDEYRIMASSSHPLAGRAELTAANLLEHPWVMGRRLGEVEAQFRQRFVDAGLSPPVQSLESSSLDFVRTLVRDGGYLTLLPSRLVHVELGSRQWTQLDVAGFSWERPLVVYTRLGEPQSDPQARLLQALRNAAEQAA